MTSDDMARLLATPNDTDRRAQRSNTRTRIAELMARPKLPTAPVAFDELPDEQRLAAMRAELVTRGAVPFDQLTEAEQLVALRAELERRNGTP